MWKLFSFPLLGTLVVGSPLVWGVNADAKPEDDATGSLRIAASPPDATTHVPPGKSPTSGRTLVQAQIIPAEIIPLPGKANAAASALQRRGFRVLHIGVTVSVEGPETLWSSVFNVSFETRRKRGISQIKGGDVDYRSANIENLKIPADLTQSIAEVGFVEPPEFY